MRWLIYDDNERNTTVFRLRIVNNTGTSVMRAIQERSEPLLMINVDETVQDLGEVTELTPRTLFPDYLEPAVGKR